jgi:hypothetical protein
MRRFTRSQPTRLFFVNKVFDTPASSLSLLVVCPTACPRRGRFQKQSCRMRYPSIRSEFVPGEGGATPGMREETHPSRLIPYHETRIGLNLNEMY